MDSLPRDRPLIGTEQEDLLAPAPRGTNHPFTQTEFHLPRLEIRYHYHQSPNQLFRFIRRFDSRKHGSTMLPTLGG